MPPDPRPRSIRPPAISSTVAISFANGTGCRKFGDATNVPSRMREVASAAAVSVGMVAPHGSPASDRQERWSYVHA